MEPSEGSLDLPAAAVATQFATFLRFPATAVCAVRRDETDAMFPAQAPIQPVAIIRFSEGLKIFLTFP